MPSDRQLGFTSDSPGTVGGTHTHTQTHAHAHGTRTRTPTPTPANIIITSPTYITYYRHIIHVPSPTCTLLSRPLHPTPASRSCLSPVARRPLHYLTFHIHIIILTTTTSFCTLSADTGELVQPNGGSCFHYCTPAVCTHSALWFARKQSL